MATLRDIRKRIRSVKSTQQITKAMKMVAAAKLRRAQDRAISARPYAKAIDELMGHLISRIPPENRVHPLLTERPVRKVEIVLVTSDRGLAGGFNANVCRRAWRLALEVPGREVTFTTIGRKGLDFLRQRGRENRADRSTLWKHLDYATVEQAAKELSDRFVSGAVDAVYLVYNAFATVMTQVPTTTQLLPFEASSTAEHGERSSVDYLYEPDATTVLTQLIPRAMNLKFFRALLESFAAEHAARMTAMDNATRSAREMIGDLTLYYNRSRQAQITRELVEIVSGAEALKG